MNPEVKTQWLEALRSGKYLQSHYRLHRHETNSFCCLGVLCDLYKPDWSPTLAYGHSLYGRTSITQPPEFVREWAGVNPIVCLRLSEMNDTGASFSIIADYIEKEL